MNRHERRAHDKIKHKNSPTLAASPQVIDAMNRAYQHQLADELEITEKIYHEVLALQPDFADALCLLGMAKESLGAPLEISLPYINRAIELDGNNYLYHYNKGLVLQNNQEHEAAIVCFTRCLEIKPHDSNALLGLGNSAKNMKQFERATTYYEELLRYHPTNSTALSHLGTLHYLAGRLEQSITHYTQALAIEPHAKFHSDLLFLLNYDANQTSSSLLAAHKHWDELYAAPLASTITAHSNDADPDKILKIGYVSADLRRHPVGDFLLPALWFHDKKQFKIYCYSSTQREDTMTVLLKKCADSWHNVLHWSDDALAAKIREDGIDILVDLSGHTADNRLLVFARKPAPIQASWIGYFNTTGMATMDYFISDEVHIPVGAETGFTEEIIRLPDAYISYAPRINMSEDEQVKAQNFAGYDINLLALSMRLFWHDIINLIPFYNPTLNAKSPNVVKTTPAQKNHFITFGSFNNIAKLTPQVMALWAEIMHKVPGSRLLLKAQAFSNPANHAHILDAFSELGIAPERLQLYGWSGIKELYNLYNEVDIALDPFPFNGGATTCDALWMGVPLVTLAGNYAVSRQSATYLTQVGLSELITGNTEEYAALAVSLSNDLPRLTALRSTMRQRMLASPLCDGPRFAGNLENAFRHMWQRWCAERNPTTTASTVAS
jgi:protein O-GlcNAc transferase